MARFDYEGNYRGPMRRLSPKQFNALLGPLNKAWGMHSTQIGDKNHPIFDLLDEYENMSSDQYDEYLRTSNLHPTEHESMEDYPSDDEVDDVTRYMGKDSQMWHEVEKKAMRGAKPPYIDRLEGPS